MTSNSHRWSSIRYPGGDQFVLSYCHETGVWQRWGRGGSRVSWLLQNGGSWECGNGGAGVCWQTVEDGLWSFPNVCAWICWRWRNSVGAEWATIGIFCWEPVGGRRGRDKKHKFCSGGEREAETESLILWLVVLELLVGGWWLREVHCLIRGWLEKHILYTWLWERQPWGWVRLSD